MDDDPAPGKDRVRSRRYGASTVVGDVKELPVEEATIPGDQVLAEDASEKAELLEDSLSTQAVLEASGEIPTQQQSKGPKPHFEGTLCPLAENGVAQDDFTQNLYSSLPLNTTDDAKLNTGLYGVRNEESEDSVPQDARTDGDIPSCSSQPKLLVAAVPCKGNKRVESLPALNMGDTKKPQPQGPPEKSEGSSSNGLSNSTATNSLPSKELGLVSDLMIIGLPKDHSDRLKHEEESQRKPQAVILENRESSNNPTTSNADQSIGELNKLLSLSDGQLNVQGATAVFTDVQGAAAVVSDISGVPNDVEVVNELRDLLQNIRLEEQIITIKLHRDSPRLNKKHSKKKDRSKRATEDSGYLTNPESSRTRSSDPQRPSSSKTTGAPRNVSGFSRQNSNPGVCSDDEFAINGSCTTQRTGRRSAPVFSRRGFGASEFWNSGQTAIKRTLINDVGSTLANRLTGRKEGPPSIQTGHRRDRSRSLGDDAGERRRRKQEKESVSGLKRDKGGHKNYGSTASTSATKNKDSTVADHRENQSSSSRDGGHRGYYSECETGDRASHDCNQIQDSVYYTSEERPRSRILKRAQSEDCAGSLHDDAKLEKLFRDSVDKARVHGGTKGVFRTPRTASPRDPVKEAVVDNRTAYDYIIEKSALKIVKEKLTSNSGEEEDDDSSDENGDDEESSEDEKDPLLGDSDSSDEKSVQTRTEVYARRWYLLFLFSLFALIWNAVWSTWGPIAQSAKTVFSWTDGDIAMFTWLGNIPFLVTMFPIAYLMDVKGMRLAMVTCCFMTFLGTGLRCIPADVGTATWLINAGQLLNGIAGTVPVSGPALLSGLWFPPNQRATATAISTVMGYLGACISFVVGPMLVPEPNNLSPINSSDPNTFLLMVGNSSNSSDISAQKQGIMNILYFEFGAASLLFFLVLIYFPSKPPLPPSISASIPREKYMDGLKLLVRNKQFWVTAIAYSVPIGVYEVWQVVLDVNLNPRVSQTTAGWMDFYATIGGCISGLLVSRFADLFTRQMKLFLLVFYFLAAISMLWFTLVVLDILPFDQVSIYASIVIGGVFLDGGAPLFFELVIEVSYPVGEGVTSGCLQMICAAAGVVFLSLAQIESIGKQWMNWCFFGCITIAIPLLFFINTTYGRADIDDMEIEVSEDEDGSTTTEDASENEKTALLPAEV